MLDTTKLEYVVNGEVNFLPMWCLEWPDNEIEEAKRIAIEDAENEKKIKDDPIVIDEKDIRKQLKEAGFYKAEISEIIRRVYEGQSLDSAMQTILLSSEI